MLINLKTNKIYDIKRMKRKGEKKKGKRRIPLYLGKWECLNMLHNQRAYTATTNIIAFCRKNFNHTYGWLSLVCYNIYSLFTQNRSLVTLNIVNDEI